MDLQFRVLGPVEVTADGSQLPIRGGRLLTLLAGLLLRANQVVPVQTLARWLWDGETHDERRSRSAVQTYVGRLRRALGSDDIVQTAQGGYRIAVDPQAVDLGRFRLLTESARRAADDGDYVSAAAGYTAAMQLWRGTPLSNVDSDLLRLQEAALLDEQRLQARERWAQTQLRLGEHKAVIAELTAPQQQYPLREGLAEQLMIALYRDARQAEALAVFQDLSHALREELGLYPNPSLQRIYRSILDNDPALNLGETADTVPIKRPVVAHQLPADVVHFCGRDEQLDTLAAVASRPGANGTVRIACVEGMGGVGKTALTVHFAHSVADAFQDGQLYLNLRGYGPGEPIEPRGALEVLLQGLGVTGPIPADLDARAALWRTHTAGRKLLVLLDNARDTAQVRPLLPGPGGIVLITSRAQLRGLAAREGARRIALDELSKADAMALLNGIVGTDRITAQPGAAAEILTRCARLPLAIRILGERIAQQPSTPLHSFIDELAAERDRLAVFDLQDDEDTDLRAVFQRSYRALEPFDAKLFRLIAMLPGADIAPGAAAAAAGEPAREVQAALDRLAGAHLIEQRSARRFEFHDLMRSYAAELAEQTDSAQDRMSAVTRLLDWYLHTCASASRTVAPTRPLDVLPDPLPGTTPLRFGSYRQALDWFDAERPGLIAAIRNAHMTGQDRYCWLISWVMLQYFLLRTHADDWLSTHEQGIASAERLGDRLAVAIMQFGMGLAHYRLDDHISAIAYYDLALAASRELGQRRRVASIQANRTGVLQRLERYAESAAAGEEALAIARDVDAPELIAGTLYPLAVTYVRLGRDTEAVLAGEQALAMHRQMRDRDREALTLRALGTVYAELHRDADALAAYRRAARLHHELEVPYDEAAVLVDLGDLCHRRGEHGEARNYWQQALALLVELRLPAADRVVARLTDSGAQTSVS